IEEFEFINLKVDPEESLKLQDKYAGSIKPGYHMNKKHWISATLDESLPDDFIESLSS
ncbi:MAG: MmcQ/YjbR family DNA-binding protein, partial [Bacteroidetes bacterium]